MTATVECPDGHKFTLGENVNLSPGVSGYEYLTVKDQFSLVLNEIKGLIEGYELSMYDGASEVTTLVTKEKVTTLPMKRKNQFPLMRGNVYVLGGGTKVIPNE